MRIGEKIATIAGTAMLAITLLAAGFGTCCLPMTTNLLSKATSDSENAPYTHEQLTELALQTRAFTVDDYGRASDGNEGAETTLANAILQAANAAAAPSSPTHDAWSSQARAALDAAVATESPATAAFVKLAGASDAYSLDADAISHLQDCNALIRGATPWLWAAAALSFALLAALHLGNRRNRACAKVAARMCIAAPIVLAVFLAACGIWALVDFNGFFAAFHGVLFPQGNWTFSATSLLIRMYPLEFWMGMGATWLVVSLAACLASLALAAKLRKL